MTQTTDQECAEFEAQFKHLDLTQEPDAWGAPRYKHDAISLAWEAWQAARRAQVVPKGWKLVPEEASSDMVNAGEDAFCGTYDYAMIPDVYAAMLATAPQPPEAAPVQMPEQRWYSPSPGDAAHFPYYTPEDVSQLLAQHGIK